MRIAINGFGRIGRLATRMALERGHEIVAINDPAATATLAHLYNHDSTYGPAPIRCTPNPQSDAVGFEQATTQQVPVTHESGIQALDWDDALVIEASGQHRNRADLQAHLAAGARRVLLGAPGDADLTVVLGVNDHLLGDQAIVSNASCTTNCIAPVLKVLDEAYGIESATATTVHAVTNDQRLVDAPHKDLRRARSAFSIIPTATGAAKAVDKVLPHLAGKIHMLALRVPVPDVSLVDLSARIGPHDDLMPTFQAANLPGILRVEDEPLVSVDYMGESCSTVIDGPSLASHGDTARVLAWYDNEWGYACRLLDVAERMA